MRYWTESPWIVRASPQLSGVTSSDLTSPFALIGPGACCQLQVPARGAERATYFLCVFDHGIEIWPLCAIAFARWGLISTHTMVLLGSYRLRFELSGDATASTRKSAESNNPLAAIQENPVELEIQFGWGERSRTKTIGRNVTIIGGRHPSTLRVKGQGLRACDHAMIAANSRLWLVDLHPDLNWSWQERVTEVFEDGTYYRMGGLRVSRGESTIESEISASLREKRQSIAASATREREQAKGTDAFRARYSDSGEKTALMSGEINRLEQAAGADEFEKSAKVYAEYEKQGGNANLTSAELAVDAAVFSSPLHKGLSEAKSRIEPTADFDLPSNASIDDPFDEEDGMLKSTGIQYPDEMTSQLTGRLVKIGQTRKLRRRFLTYVALFSLTTAAIVAVLALVQRILKDSTF